MLWPGFCGRRQSPVEGQSCSTTPIVLAHLDMASFLFPLSETILLCYTLVSHSWTPASCSLGPSYLGGAHRAQCHSSLWTWMVKARQEKCFSNPFLLQLGDKQWLQRHADDPTLDPRQARGPECCPSPTLVPMKKLVPSHFGIAKMSDCAPLCWPGSILPHWVSGPLITVINHLLLSTCSVAPPGTWRIQSGVSVAPYPLLRTTSRIVRFPVGSASH